MDSMNKQEAHEVLCSTGYYLLKACMHSSQLMHSQLKYTN